MKPECYGPANIGRHCKEFIADVGIGCKNRNDVSQRTAFLPLFKHADSSPAMGLSFSDLVCD